MTQNNLGLKAYETESGERKQNIELAIILRCCRIIPSPPEGLSPKILGNDAR
jgi:hypothetical protein